MFCCPAIVPGVDNLELPSEPFPVSFCLGRNDEQVRVMVRVRVSGRNDEQVLNKHGSFYSVYKRKITHSTVPP